MDITTKVKSRYQFAWVSFAAALFFMAVGVNWAFSAMPLFILAGLASYTLGLALIYVGARQWLKYHRPYRIVRTGGRVWQVRQMAMSHELPSTDAFIGLLEGQRLMLISRGDHPFSIELQRGNGVIRLLGVAGPNDADKWIRGGLWVTGYKGNDPVISAEELTTLDGPAGVLPLTPLYNEIEQGMKALAVGFAK